MDSLATRSARSAPRDRGVLRRLGGPTAQGDAISVDVRDATYNAPDAARPGRDGMSSREASDVSNRHELASGVREAPATDGDASAIGTHADESGDGAPPASSPAASSWSRRRPIILGQVVGIPAKTDWRRIATVVGVLAFFVWILSGFLARSDDTQRIAKRLEEASRDVAKQEAKVEVLRTQVAYLATDAFVEVAAREKLGLVKPGDRPIVVLPEVDEVAWVPPAPPARAGGPFGPRYGRVDDWLRMFFGGADEGILGRS